MRSFTVASLFDNVQHQLRCDVFWFHHGGCCCCCCFFFFSRTEAIFWVWRFSYCCEWDRWKSGCWFCACWQELLFHSMSSSVQSKFTWENWSLDPNLFHLVIGKPEIGVSMKLLWTFLSMHPKNRFLKCSCFDPFYLFLSVGTYSYCSKPQHPPLPMAFAAVETTWFLSRCSTAVDPKAHLVSLPAACCMTNSTSRQVYFRCFLPVFSRR